MNALNVWQDGNWEEIGSVEGIDFTPSENESFIVTGEQPLTIEFSATSPDPELLDLLFGESPPSRGNTVEIITPIKRKWWQRLLRRPVRYRHILIPNARVEPITSEEDR